MNNIKNRIDKATKYLKILSQAEKELKLAKKAETELRKKALIKIAIKAKEYINKQKALKIKGGNKEELIDNIRELSVIENLTDKDKELIIDNIRELSVIENLTNEDKELIIDIIRELSVIENLTDEDRKILITAIKNLINLIESAEQIFNIKKQEKEELDRSLVLMDKRYINNYHLINERKSMKYAIFLLNDDIRKINKEIKELKYNIDINKEINDNLKKLITQINDDLKKSEKKIII
jgi:hypothetical protein